MFLALILVVIGAVGVYYTYSLAPPAHLSHGEDRRKVFHKLPKQQILDGMTHSTSYITSADGDLLYTQSWIPVTKPKANIFMLHGYADWIDFHINEYALHLAQHGYAVYGMDHYGHGRSDGLHVDVRNWDRLVRDATNWIQGVQATPTYGTIKSFGWGESMGGAVALDLSLRHPGVLDGLLLAAPMVRIADDMQPAHPMITKIAIQLASIVPTLTIAPVPDVIHLCFKDPIVTKAAVSHPCAFSAKPRLATALTMLTTTLSLHTKLSQINIPFFVMHGDNDRVTEAKSSEELYRIAQSKDKRIKLYPGRWHSILAGEPLENQREVYHDMLEWLDQRI